MTTPLNEGTVPAAVPADAHLRDALEAVTHDKSFCCLKERTQEAIRAALATSAPPPASGLVAQLQESRAAGALLDAARKVIEHMEGRQPVRGWLRDNDRSRTALNKLVVAVEAHVSGVRVGGPTVGVETLRQHWLHAMECDHATGRDKPHCACSRIDLGWHPSVGAAVESWLAHVSGMEGDAKHAATSAPPPVEAPNAEDVLREALRTQGYREDGNLMTLAGRVLHMAREDRDVIQGLKALKDRYKASLDAAPPPVEAGEPSDERIFELAKQHFGGKGHDLIWADDPLYAGAMNLPADARWTRSSVRAEQTLTFARALIAATHPKGDAK